MSFVRKVVKYRDSEGRKHREVVKHASPNVSTRNLKGITDVVSFESQKDGTIHIIQKSLVDEIVLEEEDPKYCTYHKIGNVDF